jgi:hypothetical protein
MLPRTLLAFAAVAVLAAPSGALSASKDTVYFHNLNSNTVKPKVLFFAFNNGPRMVAIHWHHWGSRRAVGYGTWMARFPGSEGSEEELDVRPARIVLTDRRACKKWDELGEPQGLTFYNGVKLITWDGRYKRHVDSYSTC